MGDEGRSVERHSHVRLGGFYYSAPPQMAAIRKRVVVLRYFVMQKVELCHAEPDVGMASPAIKVTVDRMSGHAVRRHR